MTSIVCHPQSPDWIWAGAACGGVWQSDDAGRTWRSVWGDYETSNIGSLAIDPNNPTVIYCGTGEANLSFDSYAGAGLFRTEDRGETWELIAPCMAEDDLAARIPTRIGVIAIDPFDSRHLRIGGIGSKESSPLRNDFGGMFVSRDRGLTWRRESFVSADNYWCHAIAFHPTEPGVIFATVTEHGSRSGVWCSEDEGKRWIQLTDGLPRPENFGRTSLAISPSRPDVMYAFAENAHSGKKGLLLGVFRSLDRGKSWREIGGRHFAREDQIYYGNTIVVHPHDHNYVVCGGVDLHLTKDAGKTWTRASRWYSRPGRPKFAHADHHHLLMPSAAPGRVYSANDGGVDVSENGGTTWSNRSKGLAVTMYYDVDVAQNDGKHFGGGAQDNGTLATRTGRNDDHFEINDGDGGWIVYDPNDASHIFVSSQNMDIRRWRNGRSAIVSPPAPDAEKKSVWMVYISMDPGNPEIVFTGSRRVWRTRNDGKKWRAVSAVLDGSPITAIEIAAADSGRVYVGTENGGFFRSLDGGNTWSANLAGATLPGHTITRIESTLELGADFLYVTFAHHGHSHLFRSEDGGISWEDSDGGQLPDVPHHAVVIRPGVPETVYVGNDVGVFVSTDSGRTWMNMTWGLPNVMVVDLVVHERDNTLTAATYGRSLWRAGI